MKDAIKLFVACVIVIVTLSGCSRSTANASAVAVTRDFHLAEEPSGAVEILDAKDVAKDGQPIVLVGRLGGGINPWIDGRAAFLLVDTRIAPSCADGDQCEAGCPDCNKEMIAASTMVKFLGDDGKVLALDARELLACKEQSTLVVRGTANRDAAGNLSVSAERIFVRK